jgi:hypothetical protein
MRFVPHRILRRYRKQFRVIFCHKKTGGITAGLFKPADQSMDRIGQQLLVAIIDGLLSLPVPVAAAAP